jgi:hypothetical protein
MAALDQNPDRRFIYVEIAYFWRWWNEQTDEMHEKVRGFVNEGKSNKILLYIMNLKKKVVWSSYLVVGV